MSYEDEYLDHMTDLLELGAKKDDRTGTGTVSIFGHQIVHNMRDGFPLLTTKKVFTKGIIHELLWFLKGETNIKSLTDNGVHIWDEWATDEGELGPVYGEMWRNWPTVDGFIGIDQIKRMILTLKNNPNSRRNIVSAWNPDFLPSDILSPKENAESGRQALPPCHTFFQTNCEEIPFLERLEHERAGKIYVEGAKSKATIGRILDKKKVPKYYLDLQLYQRSADWFLGVPFNAASYSLLLMMLAQVTNMVPRNFIHTFGDTHLYLNHLGQANEQLSREPKQMPHVRLNARIEDIDDFIYDDFEIVGYDPHPAIKAEVSV